MTGDLDVYVEYTGTALTAVFHRPVTTDSRAAFEEVRDLYSRSGRTVLPPLGFDNTFAILVRGKDARALGLKTIDDAAREAPRWQAGFGYEFLERPDGYPGLAKAYGLKFSERAARHGPLAELSRAGLRPGRSHRGRHDGRTDPRARPVQLEDNRHYFPPYEAAPVARAATLLKYPQVRRGARRPRRTCVGRRHAGDELRGRRRAP